MKLPVCISRDCHIKNLFRPVNFASFLEGQYRNWQAIKTDIVNLFINGDYPSSDIEVARKYLGEVKVFDGLRYKTGVNKWSSFWSVKELDEKMIEKF